MNRLTANKLHKSLTGLYVMRALWLAAVCTYKVILYSQPLGAVLLQEPLQQLPACVRHVGLEHGRLVQDVVVHLGCVATVERGL